MGYDRSDAREQARNEMALELARLRDDLRAQHAKEQKVTELSQTLASLAPARSSESRRATLLGGAVAEVASPCSEDWNAMVGDDRVRHCSRCQKNVYDLSAMTTDEATALLATRGERCIRFFRRRDGTMLTSDCPVGRPKKLALRVLAAVAVAIGASAVGYSAAEPRGRIDAGDALMGDRVPTS